MSIPKGNEWIEQIFEAKAAKTGGTVRRKISSVEKHASLADLQEAVVDRDFHLVRIGDRQSGQYVVLCNKGTIKLIC